MGTIFSKLLFTGIFCALVFGFPGWFDRKPVQYACIASVFTALAGLIGFIWTL